MKQEMDSRVLSINRTLDAPREVVWQAMVDRDQAMQWWGPKDFTVSNVSMDLRSGGRWSAVIRSPAGKEYPQYGIYREIVEPELLTFSFVWGNEGPDSEMEVSFHLTPQGHKTEIVFQKRPFQSEESRESERVGWNECFDRLTQYVESNRLAAAWR